MKHTTSRMLFAYWDGLRGERVAPERADLQPGDMRHVLADTFILGEDESGAPALRLAGSRLCALFGHDLKDARFSTLWPPGCPEPAQLLGLVNGEAAGVVAGLVGTNDEGESLPLELVLLPLRHRGRIGRRTLGALSPASIPSWAGLLALTRLETRTVRIIEARRERELLPPSGLAAAGPRRPVLVVHEGGRT